VAELGLFETLSEMGIMSEVRTIGLDLAKNVFQVHGADTSGAAVFRKQLRRAARAGFEILWWPATVPGCDGSLRKIPFLGSEITHSTRK
jgi:hypothetical protein